jgi:hypothetical protein
MNTTLALPKIETKPKATKAQLIEALVMRERELWKEKRDSIEARIKPLREEINNKAYELMLKSDKDSFRFFTRTYSNIPHIEVEFFAKSPAIATLIKQVEKIDQEAPTWFDDVRVKAHIKDSLAAPKKDNPLLGNPEVTSALDSILRSINGGSLAICAQDVEVVTE